MSEAHDHVLPLLAGYALGILSAQEAETVRQHLAQCAPCRQELQAYEEVNADLALAVPEVAPPPGLEERLLERVAPRPDNPPGLWARLETWWRQLHLRPAWVAVPALALLLIFFLAWSGILGGSSFPTVALAGTGDAPDASGLLVSSEDGLHGTLVVQRLPTVDEETKTYQLWLIEAGAWEDGGTFNVDEDGYGARYASATILLTEYDSFAVTLEPAGGSPTPTGPVVLRGDQ
jgi:anti-sigma-K factor RskA